LTAKECASMLIRLIVESKLKINHDVQTEAQWKILAKCGVVEIEEVQPDQFATLFSKLTITLYSLIAGEEIAGDFGKQKSIENLLKYFVTCLSVHLSFSHLISSFFQAQRIHTTGTVTIQKQSKLIDRLKIFGKKSSIALEQAGRIGTTCSSIQNML